MATVFVSYRRSDSSASTGRIADRLQSHFGGDSIFYDVDTIPLGIDFKEYLNDRLDKCDIFLAIIGDGWVNAQNPDGSKRLEDARDNVRLEVATALNRQDIPVVPVLVGTVGVPEESELPDDLKQLADRNGIAVRSDADFDGQVGRLIAAIEQRLGTATTDDLKKTAEKPKPAPAPTPAAEKAAPIAPAPPAKSGIGKKIGIAAGVLALIAIAYVMYVTPSGPVMESTNEADQALQMVRDASNSTANLNLRLQNVANEYGDGLSSNKLSDVEEAIDGLTELENLRQQAIEIDDDSTAFIGDQIDAMEAWAAKLASVRNLKPADLGDGDMQNRMQVLETGTYVPELATYANCDEGGCVGNPQSVFDQGQTIHIVFQYERHADAGALIAICKWYATPRTALQI